MGQMAVWVLTVGAGLATCVGALLCFGRRARGEGFLAFALAFSAGVMTAVSLCDLLPAAAERNAQAMGRGAGGFFTLLVLVVGMLLAELLRVKVPEPEYGGQGEMLRVGIVSLLAVAAHNLPEGMLVSLTAAEDLRRGLPVAIAIALHNIPEGIAIAAPVLFATGSRKKALLLSLFAGLTEPLGAFIALTLLGGRVEAGWTGALFAAISGLMLAISFGELLPTAAEKDKKGTRLRQGLFAGTLVMLLVLLVL